MKNRYVIGPAIGAAIGLMLGYFGADSAGAVSLAVGAGIGALVGLFVIARISMPAGGATGGGQPGAG